MSDDVRDEELHEEEFVEFLDEISTKFQKFSPGQRQHLLTSIQSASESKGNMHMNLLVILFIIISLYRLGR
jgi:hypothetical protein